MFKHDKFYQFILQERDENAIEQFPKSVKRFSDKNCGKKQRTRAKCAIQKSCILL